MRRYKRFLADVELDDGRLVTAHTPNPGRMTGLVTPGRRVVLSESDNPRRKLKYTWELLRLGSRWVGVNPMHSNRLVQEAIARGVASTLAGYDVLRRGRLPSPGRVGKVRLPAAERFRDHVGRGEDGDTRGGAPRWAKGSEISGRANATRAAPSRRVAAPGGGRGSRGAVLRGAARRRRRGCTCRRGRSGVRRRPPPRRFGRCRSARLRGSSRTAPHRARAPTGGRARDAARASARADSIPLIWPMRRCQRPDDAGPPPSVVRPHAVTFSLRTRALSPKEETMPNPSTASPHAWLWCATGGTRCGLASGQSRP